MTSHAKSCPDLPDFVITRQLGNFPRKVNYGFSKKFETTELGTFSIRMKGLSLQFPTSSLNIDEYTKFLYLSNSYRNL